MARKQKPNGRFTLAERVAIRFERPDSAPVSIHPSKQKASRAKLSKFDPRVIELVRLLGRQTARDVIEQAMNKTSTRKDASEPDQE